MKIYTKSGDAGKTGLFGGERVPKDHLRICAYGTLDELNSVLGLLLTEGPLPGSAEVLLRRVQGEIFQLGAELATPSGKKVSIDLIDAQHVTALEKEIDGMEAQLFPLKTFILPGGAKASAWAHLARTVSRRAERELVSLHHVEPVRPVVLQYVNRLSDALFVCARYFNHAGRVSDVPWIAPRRK